MPFVIRTQRCDAHFAQGAPAEYTTIAKKEVDYRHTYIFERRQHMCASLKDGPEGQRGVTQGGNVAANLRRRQVPIQLRTPDPMQGQNEAEDNEPPYTRLARTIHSWSAVGVDGLQRKSTAKEVHRKSITGDYHG